jgi:tRNA threonylcarbamoyladenosine biosynthesis protein TsaB
VVRSLALETSGRAATLALLDGETLLAAHGLPESAGTAAALAPAIAELLRSAAWRPADIELIAVAIGPGSFTGLRVGVTTAKTMAYALRCEVLGVDTLEVIAAQVSPPGRVCAVLDAQRQQLFCGRYELDDTGNLVCRQSPHIVDAAQWLASLAPGETATGLGLRRIVLQLPAGVTVAPESDWQPRAETVGRLALRQVRSGRRDDLWKLSPNYLRRSAAEEKHEATGVP